MWLDANDINGDGNTGNNPAYLSSVDLWVDKSGKGNNAFKAPVGDPLDGTAAGFPGASGGVTHAEILGPLPPAPVFVDRNVPTEERPLTPSGLPAVRFNTCNDAPQFPGCNVTPPTYPNQTGLMTNYHAHPDPSMITFDLGKPAVPDLTIVAVVRPTFINDYHPIWTFDGNLGGHNRSLAAIHDVGGKAGLWTDGGPRILYEDPLERWMITVVTYDYNGTDADPGPKPHKLYVNSPEPIVATAPESIQGMADAPMTIGWFPFGYTQGNNITMLLSEFIVFERTLTDAEVNTLGFELATKYGITTTFTGGGITGDYNSDGKVDAADYVVWRDNEGTMNPLPNEPAGGTVGAIQYNNWRANFGSSAAAAGAAFGSVAVPEPNLLVLVLGAVLAAPVRSMVRRTKRNPSRKQPKMRGAWGTAAMHTT
jgi:hypothetical protein